MHGADTFDCAGLVWFIYHELFDINLYDKGFGLSTTTKLMTSKYGKLILYNENEFNKNLCLIKKGDIVFFHRQSLNENKPKIDNKYPGHCGIYLGNNNFIHCSRTDKKVVLNNFVDNPYWERKLVASKDILTDKKVLIK